MSLRPRLPLVCLATVILISLQGSPLGAASGTPEQAVIDKVIQVTADRMISDMRTDAILFSGNVELHRGDLFVKADRLEVKQNRQSNKVSEIVALGSVFIRKGDQAATADRAVFFEDEQRVVLTGNPHAWEGNTEVWGEEMVFSLTDRNMTVTGGAQRVRVQMLPGAEGTKLPSTRAKGQGG